MPGREFFRLFGKGIESDLPRYAHRFRDRVFEDGESGVEELAVGAVDTFGVDFFEELAEIVPLKFNAFLLEANGGLNAGDGVVAGKHRADAGFEILLFLVGDAWH